MLMFSVRSLIWLFVFIKVAGFYGLILYLLLKFCIVCSFLSVIFEVS